MKVIAIGGTASPGLEDNARFTDEVTPCLDALARRARRLARSEADAEDLLQETLLRAYKGFHTFTADTNVKAWLFRILHNQWVSAHRWRECRPAEVLSDDISDGDLAAFGAHTSRGLRSVEDEVIEPMLDGDLQSALNGLSDGHRAVIYYADVEGHTYARIAEIMGIPIGTVMSRVSRARTQMRRVLADADCARGRGAAVVRDAA